MSEENIIRLGACGQAVLDMVVAASRSARSDWYWGWSRDWFTRLPDGEAAYVPSRETLDVYSKSQAAKKRFSDDERTVFKRKLAKCIWLAFCAGEGMTAQRLLESGRRSEPAVPGYEFTVGQCCLFCDVLNGKKRETLLKRYTREELDAVVSSREENTLKVEALRVLMEEVEKLKKEQTEKVMKLHEEVSRRENALKAEYREKLDRLQRQIEETRNGK